MTHPTEKPPAMPSRPATPERSILRKPIKVKPAPVAVAARAVAPTPARAAVRPPDPTRKPRLRKPRPGDPGFVAPTAPPPAVATSAAGERLSKRVMQLKNCSRKDAEQFIEGGWVQVNGVVVEEPQHRVDRQSVTIDPEASLLNLTPVTLLLNKPAGTTDGLDELPPPGVSPAGRGAQAKGHKPPPPNARSLLTASNHWAHDASGLQPLKRHFNHLEADVELETGATGLVVFTQDWRTTRKLTEDLGLMEQEYLVEVKGEVEPDALKPILYALKDERNALPPVKVSVNSSSPEMSRLRFAVKGSHPGLVAYLCGQANLEIVAMRRIRLGRVALADLPVGQWRYLADYEKF